jgi:disease resistance protein RPM1
LFNKKAFRFNFNGYCPKELVDTSFKIVRKCKGLPLAIVAIGGLLSTKEKNVFEWRRFCENDFRTREEFSFERDKQNFSSQL